MSDFANIWHKSDSKETQKKLDKNKSLISFVGAPWTLLTYMFSINREKVHQNILELDKVKRQPGLSLNILL